MESPHQFVLMIPRSETEKLLEEYLQAPGIQAERELELRRFHSTGDGISCVLVHSDGRQETVEASRLISSVWSFTERPC